MSGMPGEWRCGGGWINTDSPNNHYTGLQNGCISSSVQQHLVVVDTYYTYVYALTVVAMSVDHNLYHYKIIPVFFLLASYSVMASVQAVTRETAVSADRSGVVT